MDELDTMMQEAARTHHTQWHHRELAKQAGAKHRKNVNALMAYAKRHPDCEIAGLDRREVEGRLFRIALRMPS